MSVLRDSFEQLLIKTSVLDAAGIGIIEKPGRYGELLDRLHSALEGPRGDDLRIGLIHLGKLSLRDELTKFVASQFSLLYPGLPIAMLPGSSLPDQLNRLDVSRKANGGDAQDGRWNGVPLFSEGRCADGPTVLFLGPNSFREQVWEVRMRYLFPDLVEPLGRQFHLAMLVPDPPEHARESLLDFAAAYQVDLYRFPQMPGVDKRLSWLLASDMLMSHLQPAFVSQVQGHTYFGDVFELLRSRHFFRAVLRVAGDEVRARVELAAYRDASVLIRDLTQECAAISGADSVIVMSDWEQARVKRLTGRHVEICHRGVDTTRFRPDADSGRFGWLKSKSKAVILYLGRKSAEKGLKEIRSLIGYRAAAKNICFAFAGPGFDQAHDRPNPELGFVPPEELPALLASVDGIVLLSATESLGQVVLEALACGKPAFVRDRKYEAMFRDSGGVIQLPQGTADAMNVIGSTIERFRREGAGTRVRLFAERELDRAGFAGRYARIFEQTKSIDSAR